MSDRPQWMIDAAKGILRHLDVEAFPNPLVDIIARHYSAEDERVKELRRLAKGLIKAFDEAHQLIDIEDAVFSLHGALEGWEK